MVKKSIFWPLLLLSLAVSFNTQALNHPKASDSIQSLKKTDQALDTADTPATTQKKGIFSLFKNKEIDFFPIPVFETRPDEGQSYGLMPVVLFSDKDSKAISIILALLGQYNSTVKWDGAAIAYFYPNPVDNPLETIELYFEYGQKYAREVTLHYLNPHFLKNFYLDTRFVWLKTPFQRFFGYGATTPQSAESNFVSRDYLFETTFGYYFLDTFRLNLTERFTTTQLLSRAFTDVFDTLTRYGGQPGVNDCTHLIHALSATFDTRPNDSISTQGTLLEGTYFFSHKKLGSDTTFNGFSFEAIQLIPLFNKRTITALRFFMQDMYGSGIPFYLQSRLGGPYELRSFIPNRFTDTGKIIFSWEQRIKVVSLKIFGVPCDFYADPFVEVGRVFNHLNHLGFDDVQPVGGLAIRGLVPPNVVGRIDIAVGTEDYSIYTMLGYAF